MQESSLLNVVLSNYYTKYHFPKEINLKVAVQMSSVFIIWTRSFGLRTVCVSGTGRVVRVTAVDGWCPTVMAPYLFPECVICQVHAFGCPLRRGSLFCIIPGNPSDCCCPLPPKTPLSSLCAFTYSCPTGCSETGWHPRASEGRGALLSSTTFGSMAAATADGRWRLNHQAHGDYCGLAIVKFKGRWVMAELLWCVLTHRPWTQLMEILPVTACCIIQIYRQSNSLKTTLHNSHCYSKKA